MFAFTASNQETNGSANYCCLGITERTSVRRNGSCIAAPKPGTQSILFLAPIVYNNPHTDPPTPGKEKAPTCEAFFIVFYSEVGPCSLILHNSELHPPVQLAVFRCIVGGNGFGFAITFGTDTGRVYTFCQDKFHHRAGPVVA